MNLLKEGIELKYVKPTNYIKSLTIDGYTKDYPVYEIRFDLLFYNDQNDRIATWVNKYKQDNNIEYFNFEDKEVYNSIIHKFIVDSNKEALDKTQRNIEVSGQQEFGVVLSNGRIIDGNRRFTCLRNIEKSKGISQYFKAVILDYDIEANKKQIKMLELQLQHGVDEKIGYNPIDKLVGIYNDIIETKLLTIKEYANSVNQTEKEIEFEVERAKLMIEFLDFFNMGKQFHIAREFNLIDPLKELHKMLKKISDEDKKDELKQSVFTQFFMLDGDKTRYARTIDKIVSNTKFRDNYIEEQSNLVRSIQEEVCKFDTITQKEIAVLKSNEKVKEDLERITERYTSKVVSDRTRNQPAKQVEKACESLDVIDNNILKKLTSEQKNEISEKLDDIEKLISEIRRELNV
ncbi:MAG: hypothetical protein RR923_05680 [Bacilli bacterium]